MLKNVKYSFGLLILSSILFIGLLWVSTPSLDEMKDTFQHPHQRYAKLRVLDHKKKPIDRSFFRNATLEDIPVFLKRAVIAVEDQNFRRHFGVDPFGIIRATLKNMQTGKYTQGASTITQQVVRQMYGQRQKTISRKLKEVMSAVKLEILFSKDEILTYYLNEIYYGRGSYGIHMATKNYFDKEPVQIRLNEAILLAAIIKAPSKYAPHINPELAKKVYNQHVEMLYKRGVIKSYHRELCLNEFPKVSARLPMTQSTQRYFLDMVKANTKSNRTKDIQTNFSSKAQWRISHALDKARLQADEEFAGIIAHPSDHTIKALAGGKSYADSSFNRALNTKRTIGDISRFFLVAFALEHGIQLDTILTKLPKPLTLLEILQQKKDLWALSGIISITGYGIFKKWGRKYGIDIPTDAANFMDGKTVASLYAVINSMNRIFNKNHGNLETDKVSPKVEPSATYQILHFVFQDITRNRWSFDAVSPDKMNRWLISLGQTEIIGLWVGNNEGTKALSERTQTIKVPTIKLKDRPIKNSELLYKRTKLSKRWITIPKTKIFKQVF